MGRIPEMDLDVAYRAWLAAVARGQFDLARVHAMNLLRSLTEFPRESPTWTTDGRASFMAWCRAEGLASPIGPAGQERRRQPR